MHTEKQVKDLARAIGAVMALGTQGLAGHNQMALEIDAIAVYLGVQIATFPEKIIREQVMADVASRVLIAVEARLAALDPAATITATEGPSP